MHIIKSVMINVYFLGRFEHTQVCRKFFTDNVDLSNVMVIYLEY